MRRLFSIRFCLELLHKLDLAAGRLVWLETTWHRQQARVIGNILRNHPEGLLLDTTDPKLIVRIEFQDYNNC